MFKGSSAPMHPFAPPPPGSPAPAWQMVMHPIFPDSSRAGDSGVNDAYSNGWVSGDRIVSGSRAAPLAPMLPGFPNAEESTSPQQQQASAGSLSRLEMMLAELREHLDERLSAQAQQLEQVAQESRDMHERCIQKISGLGCKRNFSLSGNEEGAAAEVSPSSPAAAVGIAALPGAEAAEVGDDDDDDDDVEKAIDKDNVGLTRQSLETTAEDKQKSKDAIAEASKGVAHLNKKGDEWIDGESQCQYCWRRYENFIKGTIFDYLMGVFILLNTIFLGIQVDSKAQVGEEQVVMRSIESAFACIFTLEVLLRISVLRQRYCCSGWNLFDSFVVLAALFEEIVKYGIGGDTVASKLSVFRMMRVFKLLRTVRIIRVIRAFRELRIVLMSIVACMRSLLWTLCMLFIVIYVVAILILVELTGSKDPYEGAEPQAELRRKYFPSLVRTQITLFQAATGGLDWEITSTALEDKIAWIPVLWCFYIGFVVFAIANTVTGIFVDQAMKSAAEDAQNVMMEEREKRDATVATLRQVFYAADGKGRGLLSRRAVERICADKQVLMMFKQLEIDRGDLLSFFDLVANSQSKIALADIDVFTVSCGRLRGTARQMDVVALDFREKVALREKRHQDAMLQDIHRAVTAG